MRLRAGNNGVTPEPTLQTLKRIQYHRVTLKRLPRLLRHISRPALHGNSTRVDMFVLKLTDRRDAYIVVASDRQEIGTGTKIAETHLPTLASATSDRTRSSRCARPKFHIHVLTKGLQFNIELHIAGICKTS